MLTFLIRRLAFTLVTVLGAVTLTFLLANVVPSDPARVALGPDATEAQVAHYRAERGLDRPLWVQYLRYLSTLARGDLGTSIVSRAPIRADLAQFVPATVELFVPSLVFALAAGLGLGVAAALYRGSWMDQLARLVSLLGLSMPVFWLGLLLQLVFFRGLHWLPVGGRLDQVMRPPPTVTGLYTVDAALAGQWDVMASALIHLVLPAVALSTLTLGIVARMTRSSLLDTLSSGYVRTARSKGLSERVVVWRHALRSALLPVLTVVGLRIGQMFSGAVLTETVFAWPGIGRYAFVALRQLDFPVVMGVAIWATLIYSLVNLVVDLGYSLADPRVRLE